MNDGSPLRLFAFRVLVISMVVTLGARLYYLQILGKERIVQTATAQHVREVVIPSPRGPVVDDRGRPLVRNRSSLVVTVNRSELIGMPDRGAQVLARLAGVVHLRVDQLSKMITPCQAGVPKPCWRGSPYQPVPVVTDTTPGVALRIAEHAEDFPGVTAQVETVREYPHGTMAAQTVGYVGPITQEELDNAAAAGRTDRHQDDLVGRAGLERQYEEALRGTDGIQRVLVDNRGVVTGTGSLTPPIPGSTLVTSLDTDLQALVETALADQVTLRRTQFDAKNGRNFAATTGALVVLDPQTGRVLALASYPTYDPTVFVGGISATELDKLVSPAAGAPLVSRAVAGQFAAGSTFKLVSTSADVMSGLGSLSGKYSCPPRLQVGNRTKTNYDSESLSGPVDFHLALAFSCDTFFYQFAMNAWYGDQNLVSAGKKPNEYQQAMARAFGFGSDPGLDVPGGEQTSGRIPDRGYLQRRWEQNRAQYCANAKRGYPDVADPERRTFLTALASENCTDGWRFRIGDAADMAIGQGEATVSPLQLALAYSALVNGGRLYGPTVGRAIVGPDGTVTSAITPKLVRKVPVRPDVLDYIKSSLVFNQGFPVSGQRAFEGFPLDRYPVAGKTGTAEVFGKQDTSWFASWAPANRPQYVVVGMMEQAGLGSQAAAPMVRKVYEGLFGIGRPPVFPGGRAPATIPKITPYQVGAPANPAPAPAPAPPAIPGRFSPVQRWSRRSGRSGRSGRSRGRAAKR
ncbi:MAG: penicillin-binding protein 2 [Actinobacteria bacterium]|nr:penicillin-binding protein 2 [Actinomycetota bacterium]